MTLAVTVATEEGFVLGEGPVWDPLRSQLLWVDIPNGSVLSGSLNDDGTITVTDRFHTEDCAGAVAVSENGEWLIAGAQRLIVVDRRKQAHPLAAAHGPARWFNDGKPDPAGRFVVGTLSTEGPSTTERLLRVESDGGLRAIDDDLTLSNGLAWAGDGSLFYSVDTDRGLVYRRDYDVASGATGPRDVFLTIADGFPDGMTIDAEDHLWIAIWGAGQVRRYDPAGALVDTVDVPAPHTSSVAFAGAELDTLVITTARQDLTDEQLTEYPLSGRLFTIRPGVRGVPQPLWNGLPQLTTEKDDQ